MSEEQSIRLGGMALANGVLVHGPRHWSCAVRTEDGTRTWDVAGSGASTEVTGSLADLAAYLAGRRTGLVAPPTLPRWL